MTYATFTVPAGGLSARLQLDYFQQLGGNSLELAISPGADTPTWALLSDGTMGWGVKTSSSYSPPTFSSLINTDLRDAMLGRNASAYLRMPFAVESTNDFQYLKLHIKYDDGFVAWINGQKVYASNAPDTLDWNSAATVDRRDEDAVVDEEIIIPVSEGLLHIGTNILAIQGLNDSASSADFLIDPTLEGVGWVNTVDRYFQTPTPFRPNVDSGVNVRVEDIKWDHDRGFYEAPFLLSITTATGGATIRYTTDGSLPTMTTGQVYSNGIAINGTSTIRAAAFKSGFLPTEVETHTYVFADDVVKQPDGQTPPGWPFDGVRPISEWTPAPSTPHRPARRSATTGCFSSWPMMGPPAGSCGRAMARPWGPRALPTFIPGRSVPALPV